MIFTGSGVIPIIIINKKPFFILFNSSVKLITVENDSKIISKHKNLPRQILTDAGGKIEDNKKQIETASRELFEESSGLINIDTNILEKNSIYLNIKNLDKSSKYFNKYYRIYFIIIENIENLNDFYLNLKKFKKFSFNPFVETFKINLIKLNKFKKQENNIVVKTNNNEDRILNQRLTRIYNVILNKFNNIDNFYKVIKTKINPIKLEKQIIDVKTYEYYTHRNIKAKNIITYFA